MLFLVLLFIASWMSLIGLLAGQSGLSALGTGAGLLLIVWGLRRRGTRRPAPTTPPPAGGKGATELDLALLRDAIRLCRPDAAPPERRQLANAATASLTALRVRQ